MPGIGKREIGPSSFGLSGFETFGIGMTVAIFQSSGKELWSTDMLYKWVNSLCRCVMASFSILELMAPEFSIQHSSILTLHMRYLHVKNFFSQRITVLLKSLQCYFMVNMHDI